MKYIALILGLILPVTLLSCAKAEAQTAKQNVEFDSLEEKIAALEAQLGANLRYEKDDDGNERWYDSKGNLIHEKRSDGHEEWYDSNHNLIHKKDSNGDEELYEYWFEYDSNGNKIHDKSLYGDETWYEKWYDSNGNLIHCKGSYGYEEWYEYDSNGNKIHYKDSNGDEEWYEYENVTDSDYDDMFVYDSRGNLIHEKNLYGETWYEYDSTGNLVHTTDNLCGNGCCQEKIDYWSNGHIKKSYSFERHEQHYKLFNKEGKVSLTEHVDNTHTTGHVYVEYKNSHLFRIWYVENEAWSPHYHSEAFEIHYDKSGKINTVKTWCQEKDINDSIINTDNYWDLLCGLGPERCWDGSVISLEKNLEISEDNTITFKQWPPDMGGDVIHEKLLPKTDWENYFDENGNFTADGLSWIHKDGFMEKFVNDEYMHLRPQKNKH